MTVTPELIAAVASGTVALIGALTALVVAVARLNTKTAATHELVNSRMTELLELTRKSSMAQGRLAGPEATPETPSSPEES